MLAQPNNTHKDYFRKQLKCNFPQIDAVFSDCMQEAKILLSESAISNYLKGASLVCMIGRGVEPVLIYLEEMPQIAHRLDEQMLVVVSSCVWDLSRSPNSGAIVDFMQTLPEVARRLNSHDLFLDYIDLIFDMAEKTAKSIHQHIGIKSLPSPGLPFLLQRMPTLLSQLNLQGLHNFIDYGIKNYANHADNQKAFFSLESADSKAILHRERQGVLLMDNIRKLNLYSQSLWQTSDVFIPFATENKSNNAYFDDDGMRLPDVYDDQQKSGQLVSGIDRYRALIAHMQAHKRWSSKIVVDNFSPFQRIAIECLEDSRVEYLAMKLYPGLRNLWLQLHPAPIENDCNPLEQSCIKHRLAMLSYAILNPNHQYKNNVIIDYSNKFHQIMADGESSTKAMATLAISFIAKTRIQSDQLADIYFKDTVVDYRDDNRHLWIFIEEGDEEETNIQKTQSKDKELNELPPRHYHEWDYINNTYKPDWVSLYENLHQSGNATEIDALLLKHSGISKRMKRILESLKPQYFTRQRYQEEGSELDLDIAINSYIDYKCNIEPDRRINYNLVHSSRNIAVSLLMDLSASVDETPKGSNQTILQLSKEAVALLSWSIDKLGDKFSISGFSSNTRHDVRFQHIKGYAESWDDEVKGRLAAINAGLSTRMGAAIRHAGHYLEHQKAEKKLMLVLTDGEPADVDVSDDQILHKDAKQAVLEMKNKGIYPYAVSLDADADDYVADIFGNHYSVIDNITKLPEQLPKIFIALTK